MTGHGLARMERAMRLPLPMPLLICGDYIAMKESALAGRHYRAAAVL